MFKTVLFIIVKTWKQLRCLSAGEWKNKQTVIYPDNGILYCAIVYQVVKKPLKNSMCTLLRKSNHLHDILERQNYGNSYKIISCQELGWWKK